LWRTPPTATLQILGWLFDETKIVPHIPVIEKSKRWDGIFVRSALSLGCGS